MADPIPLPSGPHPLDAMSQAAGHHGLLLENDKVRFLDTRVAPGERTAVHAHQWPAALYVLSWSDFVRYDAAGNVLLDSRTMARQPEPGEAIWAPAIGPHYVQNVGTTDLRILAVEVKD
jgi:quercetin dioxygenase-like cupin family protein